MKRVVVKFMPHMLMVDQKESRANVYMNFKNTWDLDFLYKVIYSFYSSFTTS